MVGRLGGNLLCRVDMRVVVGTLLVAVGLALSALPWSKGSVVLSSEAMVGLTLIVVSSSEAMVGLALIAVSGEFQKLELEANLMLELEKVHLVQGYCHGWLPMISL